MACVAKGAWLGDPLDQGYDGVHQQDGVHHALGQASPDADQNDENADPDAEDPGATRRQRGGHRVGRHEDGAKEEAAGAKHEERGGKSSPTHLPEDCRKEAHGDEDAYRYTPIEGAAGEEPEASEKNDRGAGFTQRARDVSPKEAGERSCLVRELHQVEGRCAGDRIGCGVHEGQCQAALGDGPQAAGRLPCGERDGEGGLEKSRPTSAGLNRLWPRPPQIVLPRAMATIPPRNAIQREDRAEA